MISCIFLLFDKRLRLPPIEISTERQTSLKVYRRTRVPKPRLKLRPRTNLAPHLAGG